MLMTRIFVTVSQRPFTRNARLGENFNLKDVLSKVFLIRHPFWGDGRQWEGGSHTQRYTTSPRVTRQDLVSHYSTFTIQSDVNIALSELMKLVKPQVVH